MKANCWFGTNNLKVVDVPDPKVLNPNDAIFASRKGTWMSTNNVRRQWRQARAEADLAWVTPHTFRKTVAALIDKEGQHRDRSGTAWPREQGHHGQVLHR